MGVQQGNAKGHAMKEGGERGQSSKFGICQWRMEGKWPVTGQGRETGNWKRTGESWRGQDHDKRGGEGKQR